MTDLLPTSFYMWGASEDCLTAGYWSYDPPTGGGNPTTRFVALVPNNASTPEALSASPEVAKLIADAEARGMENTLAALLMVSAELKEDNSVKGRSIHKAIKDCSDLVDLALAELKAKVVAIRREATK